MNLHGTLLIYNAFDAPMGGTGESGVGRRHGPEGIRRYCRQQAIVGSIPTAGGYEALQRLASSELGAEVLLRAAALMRRIPGLR